MSLTLLLRVLFLFIPFLLYDTIPSLSNSITHPLYIPTFSIMAIAPIVGKLRKQLITDLSIALGLGTTFGYAYWYGIHMPSMARRDAFYVKYEQQKAAAA